MKKNIFKQKKQYWVLLGIKLGIILGLLVLDLWTKSFFASRYEAGAGDITVLQSIFSFTYTENTGAAFSLFSNSTTVLTVLSVLFVVGFFVFDWFERQKNGWYVIGFTLISAGAVGNFVDRIWLGYVRDFMRFDFITFPIFNVADVCLTVGLVCYGIYVLFYSHKKEQVK